MVRMTNTGSRLSALLAGVVATLVLPVAVAAQDEAQAMLDSYCVRCHNERTLTANLSLDNKDLANVAADAETWEKVLVKLWAQTMPPGNSPRPDDATYRRVATWLAGEIDQVGLAHPDPGRGETFHRLNRAEYHGAIRDLLAVDVDVASLLPADNTYEHGFDNNGEMLSISPDLVNRYLSAARKISRLAVGLTPLGPAVSSYRVHPWMLQDERQDNELSFGSRGGIAIPHYFPVDGEYELQIRLHRNFSDYIIGFAAPQDIDVRIDGALVTRFSVGDAGTKGEMAPLSFSGNIAGHPDWEFYMNTGDEGLEVRFDAKAGPRTVEVSFVRRYSEPEGVLQPRNRGYGRFVDERYDENALVELVSIGGPYRVDGAGDTPARREIFACRPDAAVAERPCAEAILGRLARRAYRRPVTDVDVATLMTFFDQGRRDGTFDDGIQFALERMLVDPDFLFRIERDPTDIGPGTPYQVDDVDLASRLSFFLWSSIPDDELLALAERGELSDPDVLKQQTRRLLADPRSRALVDNFVSQWLRLRNLDDQERESAEYPEFDENLRESFRTETEMFVESTIREDRSLLELLSANYTFVNERLARHYGIPNIYGDRFRRVTFDADHPRGGLLGHGGLLMVTSHPNRTSPVLRGKWLLESILGAPPPEPPADVPGLPDRGEEGEPQSVRHRLERHRENPVCSSCHAPMDPLGFALENFDAIGIWRDTSETGQPIDASATMPSGTEFDGPAGLRDVLLGRGDSFARTVTEKLLAYALGRGLQFSDQPSVRQIVQNAAVDDYQWSSVIVGIVESAPFQWRRSRTADETQERAEP